jgi:flagellar motor switch protein FliN/FliY
VLGIPVTVDVVLGSTTMLVADLMKLGRGAILPLDGKVGDHVTIAVNGRAVARGEIVVLEDEDFRLGVSLTEVMGSASSSSGA